jgi:hypothetical protein
MASKRVQGRELQAITEWSNDTQWEERDGVLSAGVWRRLATVDRALYASNRIAEMLMRDQRGKQDARLTEGVSYQGLAAIDAEALSLAMVELGNRAEEVLEEVRENEYGCCGTLRAKS